MMLTTLCAALALATTPDIWVSPQELAPLATSGPAWQNVLQWANGNAIPNLNQQDNDAAAQTVAAALVYARTGDRSYRDKVITNCQTVIGTEGGETLWLGRRLGSYPIAARLVGWTSPAFEQWLSRVRFTDLGGRTLVSTHEDRPNNWGTWAGFSRVAVDVFIEDWEDLAAAAAVWHGWTGDSRAYSGFEFGDPCWQADPRHPVGINPPGSLVNGMNVDGVLPDDQRRSGECPPGTVGLCENYVREALAGVLASAVMLERQGYPMFSWESQAIKRAAVRLSTWGCPWPGNDGWEPWLLNWAYSDLDLPASPGAGPGRGIGFTDWTHTGSRGGTPPAGACCVGSECLVTGSPECAAQHGVYHGDGSACSGGTCAGAPPWTTGACCIGTACVITGSAECAGQGGTYHGDGSQCTGGLCAAAGPCGAAAAAGATPYTIGFGGDQDLGTDSVQVLDLIAAHCSAFVHVGDFDYHNSASQWLAQIHARLPFGFPYIAVVGNHESCCFSSYGAASAQLMSEAGVAWNGTAGQKFEVVLNGIQIVLTAPNVWGSGHDAYIQSRFAGSPYHWRVSGWHENMEVMNIGDKGNEAGWPVYERSREAGALIITGHEHSYERTYTLGSCQNQVPLDFNPYLTLAEGQTGVVVSGLMGRDGIDDQADCVSPPDPPHNCAIWASIYTSTQGADHGVLCVTFNYQGNPCRAHAVFRAINGDIPDEFDIYNEIGSCAGSGGGPCEYDLDGDGVVGVSDLLTLLFHWLDPYCVGDFLQLLSQWGPCG